MKEFIALITKDYEFILERSNRKTDESIDGGVKIEEAKGDTSTIGSNLDLSLASLPMDSLDSNLSSPREELLPSPSETPQFTEMMEQSFLASIKKIIESKQAEEAKAFVKLKESGKTSWMNTHFIFALDCSGSMKGTRWNSVMVGFSTCLERIRQMKHVCVSAFTFDAKPNPFCRERSPQQAIANSSQIPFTEIGRAHV